MAEIVENTLSSTGQLGSRELQGGAQTCVSHCAPYEGALWGDLW